MTKPTDYKEAKEVVAIPEFVQGLRPYKAGKPISELAREKGLKRIVKLASNENPLGPSPKAIEAIRRSLDQLHRYPDPSTYDLVQAISKKYRVMAEHVICGHGTDSLLGSIAHAFAQENDEILTCEGTFIGMFVNTRKFGRKLSLVPMKDYGFDLEGILNAINDRTKIIYLANPNNPTGTMIPRDQFENFMARVPQNILVILDEAYTAYASEFDDYPDGAHYWYDNMIVTRTLSKAYGLGGIRVGFAVGPKYLIDALYKVRLPFEPNHLATQAAIAALDDDEFLQRTVELNKWSLAQLKSCFEKLGIDYVPTAANFYMLLMRDEATAVAFFEECLSNGLILRHVAPFGIPNGVRINSGTEDETAFAIEVIEKVQKKLNLQDVTK